jgi:hypothetical protein
MGFVGCFLDRFIVRTESTNQFSKGFENSAVKQNKTEACLKLGPRKILLLKK